MSRGGLRVLLCCALMLGGVVNAQIIKSYSITSIPACQQSNQIMVFSASDFPYLIGQDIEELSLYSLKKQAEMSAGQWQPIIFQIDQRDKQHRFILTTGKQTRRALSTEDELVIKHTDLGEKLKADSPVLSQYSVIEVQVLSTSLDVLGWFYINVNPATGQNKVISTPELIYNKEKDEVQTENFKIGFALDSPFLVDAFHWRLDNGQWSEDLSDMMKIRHTGRFFGLPFKRTQKDYSSQLIAVKQAPLRIIRRTENRIKVFWKLKTPELYIDYILTPDGFIMDTIIDIPFKISFFFSDLATITTMDWNPEQSGKLSVYHSTLTHVVKIDGTDSEFKQRFNQIEATDFKVITDRGELNVDLQIPDNFPIHAMLYLKDDPVALDPPENYPGQVGNVGFKTIGWEDINSELYHLKFTVCIKKYESISQNN